MQEHAACALLKTRFEQAGYRIIENTMFDEDGIRFELDGFDPERRVGYEYVTAEAGDGWDVDDAVIAALAERRSKGALFILVVDETEAPDEESLSARVTAFLAALPRAAEAANEPAPNKPATGTPAASAASTNEAPAASTNKRTTRSAASANKSATKKPATKKPATKKPATKKPATKKPATKKPDARKPRR